MRYTDIKKIYYNGDEVKSLVLGGNVIYSKVEEPLWNPSLLKGKYTDKSTASSWYCKINGTKTKMPVDTTTKEFEYELSSYLTTCDYFTSGNYSTPSYIERIDNFPDTSHITSMEGMFAYSKFLKSIDLSHFNTENVTSMYHMFYECNDLTEVRMPNLDVSKVTTLEEMFYRNIDINNIDLANWDISKVTRMDDIFARCSNLETLNLKNWDFSNVTNLSDAFYNCTSLATIIGPISGIKIAFTIYYSPLTNESVMVLINGLEEIEETKHFTFKSITYDTLSEEQIALATSKGWSVSRRS